MSGKKTPREVSMRQWIGAAGTITALWAAAGIGMAAAATLVDPPVFASQNGVLDIMMVAMPQPIPSISYTPPGSSTIINPTGWVYQVCPRPTLPVGQQHGVALRWRAPCPAAWRHAEDPLRQPAAEARPPEAAA
jgi:hypothetical protein